MSLKNTPIEDQQDKRKLVLVVEDSPNVRYTIMRILERYICRVIAVDTTYKALEVLLNGKKVHVAIIDLILPEQGGLPVIKDIKNRYPDTYIIAITGGLNMVAEWWDEVPKLAENLIHKPFDNKTITDILDDVLEINKL